MVGSYYFRHFQSSSIGIMAENFMMQVFPVLYPSSDEILVNATDYWWWLVTTNKEESVKPDTLKWMTYRILCLFCTDTCLIFSNTYQEIIRRLNLFFLKTNIQNLSDTSMIRAIGGGKPICAGYLMLLLYLIYM